MTKSNSLAASIIGIGLALYGVALIVNTVMTY